MHTVYIDGNGHGYSIAFFYPDLKKAYFYYEEDATNNCTEYNGLILALMVLPENSEARVLTDSALVCGHLDKGWSVNHEHLRKKLEIVKELKTLKNISFVVEWIPRKQNIADRVLRKYLKESKFGKIPWELSDDKLNYIISRMQHHYTRS